VRLGPKEDKSVYWLIKIGEDFNPNLHYTLPLIVTTTRGTSARSEAYSKVGYPHYTEEEMKALLADLKEEDQYHYSKNLELSCKPEKAELYVYENQAISCTIRNIGNMPLTDLKACLDTDCRTFTLQIAQTLTQNFSLPPAQPGTYDKAVKLASPDLYKTTSVRYKVWDEPVFTISDLKYPPSVGYSGSYNLSCVLRHGSNSAAHNLTLTITNRQPTYYNFSYLDLDQPIILYFEGSNLAYGQNRLNISLRYYDTNGREYTSSETAFISLDEATFLERINLALVDLQLWLENVFKIE
jgi:hypothetical protein